MKTIALKIFFLGKGNRKVGFYMAVYLAYRASERREN